jgi:hypothetical protein
MVQKIFTCRPVHLTALMALSLASTVALGCGSSRSADQPAAVTTFASSQNSENAQGLTVDSLEEYGYSFPHRYNSQGSGQMVVGGRNIEWRSEHRKAPSRGSTTPSATTTGPPGTMKRLPKSTTTSNPTSLR